MQQFGLSDSFRGEGKDATDMYHLALAYLKIGRFGRAMVFLDRAIEMEPQNPFRNEVEEAIRSAICPLTAEASSTG